MDDDYPDLASLLDSWVLALRAARRSKHTIASYRTSVVAFLDWCAEHGTPARLDRLTVSAFLAWLTEDQQRSGATARTRYGALRTWSKWLHAEGEIPANELAGMDQPQVDEPVIEPYSAEELARLVKATAGRDFLARRDSALIRFLIETGCRASEAAEIKRADVKLAEGLVVIHRGKGGKGRMVGIGDQTAAALDRYLRARRGHRLASSERLWLGGGGQSFGYPGLYKMLQARAKEAGLTDMYPHRLRHSHASRWLAAGGSENGLMANSGWSDPAMVRRYAKATAGARAADEAKRLGLGDL